MLRRTSTKIQLHHPNHSYVFVFSHLKYASSIGNREVSSKCHHANVAHKKVFLIESLSSDGSATTEFETTPPMSPYLIAFHVSNFPHVTTTPPRSVAQRIFSRSTAINSTSLALETGELLMEALSDYIGVDYSLPKLDHVAVPG